MWGVIIYEIGQDEYSGTASRLSALYVSDNLATAYTTGTGTGQPQGIVTGLPGTASEINTSGTETYHATDPYVLQDALSARFSPNAVFLSHIAPANAYRQMEQRGTGHTRSRNSAATRHAPRASRGLKAPQWTVH